MAFYYGRDGKTIYELDKELKSGGEGVVYLIKGKPDVVAKIYKGSRVANIQKRNTARDKILAMLDMHFNPQYNGKLIVAWPNDALFDSSGTFQGFTMPRIQNMKSFIWAARPSDRNVLWPNGYRWHYSIAIAYNLATVIEIMHKAGIVIGDLNTNNILIDAKGNVALIDADSFNITARSGQVFKCIVGFPEVLPPELQGKDLELPTSKFTEQTDSFSLAIHIFAILCNNCHPFGCLNYNVAHGSTSNPHIMNNIVKGYCPYVSGSKEKTANDALDMDVFPSELRKLFDKTFDYTTATAVSSAIISRRPSAHEWRIILGRMYQDNRKICHVNSLHEYPSNYVKACPWCAIEKRQGNANINTKQQVFSNIAHPISNRFVNQTTNQAPYPAPQSQPVSSPSTPATSQHIVKPKAKGKIILILVLFIVAYWITMAIMSYSAFKKYDWDSAMRYMNCTPFLSAIFPNYYQAMSYMTNLPYTYSGDNVYVGEHKLIIQSGQTSLVKFIPPSSDTYYIQSTSPEDTYGCIYSSTNTSSPIYFDDDSGNDQNFRIECYLEKDQPIYIGVKYYDQSKSGYVYLYITR